jgi:hypothetical protein
MYAAAKLERFVYRFRDVTNLPEIHNPSIFD